MFMNVYQMEGNRLNIFAPEFEARVQIEQTTDLRWLIAIFTFEKHEIFQNMHELRHLTEDEYSVTSGSQFR